MIKKIIKGKDFDGNAYEDEYYFHLTTGDLIDWMANDGGLVNQILNIAKETDPIKIIPVMKTIILRSYGVKSSDGKTFIKDKETVKAFEYSDAFSELYTELSTDSEKAAEFVNGILPEFDEETQKKLDEAKAKYEKEMGITSEDK